MRSRVPRSILAACALSVLAACRGDDATDEVRAQQKEILAQLQALDEKVDKLAAARPAPPANRPTGPDTTRAYNLPAGQSPTAGPENAPITIVEFSDYECPSCARAEPLIRQALDAYPTQARFVFKHFPLTSIHPQAKPAALAAAAAQQQGKFWEMHALLFANQRALGDEQLREYARRLNLDLARFDADRESEAIKQQVQDDIRLGQRVGVRGTPTIFVNGKYLQNRSLDGFKQVIEPMLKDQPAAAPNAGG
ncbi:MAG: DsbA family protein [Candidatus Binatia bacterium]